ncbi:hypothetical protein HQ585_13220 [candidate division KSB1 bacterium]|nr:hypothetical protein [candidate division KSB1 bacterium]
MTKKYFLNIVTIFLFPIYVTAQSVPFVWGHAWSTGNAASAMGGAFSGLANDYSALYYNPAGLGQIEKIEIGGSFSNLSINEDVVYLAQRGSETSSYIKLDAFGIAVPVPTSRGSMVFGLSYNRIRQFDQSFHVSRFMNEWAPDYSAMWDQSRMEEGGLSNTSLGGSVEVAPGLYLGGAFHFWGGEDDYTWHFEEQNPFFAGIDGDVADSTSTERVLTKFSGINFSFSTLYKLNDFFQFGLLVRTPITLKAEEEWDWTYGYVWDDGYSEFYSEGSYLFDYKIQYPWTIRGGFAVAQGPITLVADAEIKNYSQMKYKSEPPEGGSVGEANITLKRTYRDVIDYSIGAQIRIPKTPISILGGYARNQAPYENAADGEDRTVLSGGFQAALNAEMSLTVSYVLTDWESATWGEAGYIITETIEASRLLISFQYQM